MRQLRLQLEIAPLAVAHFLLRPLLVGQVENKSHALTRTIAERRRPISTGTRRPSLRKYSFSKGLALPVAFNSAFASSSRSSQSGGVRSGHRIRPETRSSRL